MATCSFMMAPFGGRDGLMRGWLLEVGVALPELGGGFAALVPHGLKEGVGEQEDALFEEGSGVLLGFGGGVVLLGGRGDEEEVAGDGGERRSVAVVMARTWAPALLAVTAAWTTPTVVPEPEAAMRRSPGAMAGVVTSPTTWTVRPRCMRRMAAMRRARPLRPAPVTKMRGAARMASMAASTWASSMSARV